MHFVRGTEIQDFLRCRLRWKYAWVDRIVPKKKNGKLLFGEIMHKYLEFLYETKDHSKAFETAKALLDQADTSRMEQTELNDLLELFEGVSKHYYETWWDQDEKLNIIATELTFAIPLDHEIAYTGTIDLIYRDKDGNLIFMDHKTTNSVEKYINNSHMDRQISRYWWALQQLAQGYGYVLTKSEPYKWLPADDCGLELSDPYAFQYNIILKAAPEVPKILKNGQLSKDKRQRTTYKAYLEAVKDLCLNEDDYADILEHFREMENPFFRRIEVIRLQTEIDAAMNEFYWQAKESLELRNHLPEAEHFAYRTITSDCHWDCQYKDICVAGMNGSNVQYLIDELYEMKEENLEVDV